jgi:molybdate transport system substrate-binding protein
MRKRYLLSLLATALVLNPFATAQNKPVDLTVSAAISLKDALNDVAPAYIKDHPGTTIHFNLGASGTLQEQIQQGAPVDVYISAAPDQMDALEKQGLLLDDTRHDLVRNSIVLVVPTGSKNVSSFQDLLGSQVKFVAIGEPQTVPAGKYGQEVLTHLGLYDSLKPKFVFGKDVRSVLTYVASNNADAGIVYATDAKTTPQVTVAAVAPEDSHSPVIYPVAVLKGSKEVDAAKSFVDFLLSPQGEAVFEKYGFLSPRP